MAKEFDASPYLPNALSLKAMREAVQGCEGCPLYQRATQAVFGEGRRKAMVFLVGEQPGDQEDRAGRPFVGPAGGVLDRGLTDAGIDRTEAYVTNAVKHFKWEARGKRRIHGKPGAREVAACRPWLVAEWKVVQPRFVVALGATAAQSMFGRQFRVTRERGKLFASEQWGPECLATIHPSAILRMPDDGKREEAMAAFVADLRVIAEAMGKARS